MLHQKFTNEYYQIGFLFGGLSFVATAWAYFFVPETKDRTLEELDGMFLKVGNSQCSRKCRFINIV